LYKLIAHYTYITIAFVMIPMLCAFVLIMIDFSMNDLLWRFSLDSLITTIVLLLVLVCDMKKMERDIYRL